MVETVVNVFFTCNQNTVSLKNSRNNSIYSSFTHSERDRERERERLVVIITIHLSKMQGTTVYTVVSHILENKNTSCNHSTSLL